jgi:hypothetical protein
VASGNRLRQQHSCSFDDLVGAGEHGRWDVDAERLGRFEVDYKVELGRSLYWQIGWVSPVKNLIYVRRSTRKKISKVDPVESQPPFRYDMPKWIHGRQTIFGLEMQRPALVALGQSQRPTLQRLPVPGSGTKKEFAKIHKAVMATSPNFYGVSRPVARLPARLSIA